MFDKMPKHKMLLDPKSYRMAHPVYAMKDLEKIKVTHKPYEGTFGFRDRIAHSLVKFSRWSFDSAIRFDCNTCNDERAWLNRMIFLETVAGIPGMVGAI